MTILKYSLIILLSICIAGVPSTVGSLSAGYGEYAGTGDMMSHASIPGMGEGQMPAVRASCCQTANGSKKPTPSERRGSEKPCSDGKCNHSKCAKKVCCPGNFLIANTFVPALPRFTGDRHAIVTVTWVESHDLSPEPPPPRA